MRRAWLLSDEEQSTRLWGRGAFIDEIEAVGRKFEEQRRKHSQASRSSSHMQMDGDDEEEDERKEDEQDEDSADDSDMRNCALGRELMEAEQLRDERAATLDLRKQRDDRESESVETSLAESKAEVEAAKQAHAAQPRIDLGAVNMRLAVQKQKLAHSTANSALVNERIQAAIGGTAVALDKIKEMQKVENTTNTHTRSRAHPL